MLLRELSCVVREEPQDRATGVVPGGDAKGAVLCPLDLRLNVSKMKSWLESTQAAKGLIYFATAGAQAVARWRQLGR